MSGQSPLSVSDITARIKMVLEGSLPSLWVRGEISQLTRHRSGHWYFTLIDERSQLSCVLWKGRASGVTFVPETGQMVVVQGKVVVYERGGRYQFDAFEIRPEGVGELALAFEELKRKLTEKGYFDLERKVGLPRFPERIGVVTSPEGAALQDILRVARERAPWVEFRVAPAAVQGPSAAAEIAAGIRLLDDSGWPDVIIIGRGGGSPEDLWAFNEEAVVKAIDACQTPLVSAVGHEVDVSLADLAADLRAPTPSAAAEICLPDREALKDRLTEVRYRLQRSLQSEIDEQRRWLREYASVVLRQSIPALWREESQRVDELARRWEAGIARFLERRRFRLNESRGRLETLNPTNVLARGYAIVRGLKANEIITDAARLKTKDAIAITFHRGRAEAEITQLDETA